MANINGTADDDFIFGTPDPDVIHAGAGHDVVFGEDGDDVIYGEAGHDILLGNEGNDQLYGGDDDDFLQGGAGDDLIDGGAGYDRAGHFSSSVGVTVSLLLQGQAQNTGQGWDTFVGIEHVSGTGSMTRSRATVAPTGCGVRAATTSWPAMAGTISSRSIPKAPMS